MAATTGRLVKTCEAIKELRLAGLSKHWAGALLKQYAGAASQYVLRPGSTTPPFARRGLTCSAAPYMIWRGSACAFRNVWAAVAFSLLRRGWLRLSGLAPLRLSSRRFR
eukprot:13172731-Alexandrium_andersonii.AAC.1